MDDLRPFNHRRLRESVAVDGASNAAPHGRSPKRQAHAQKYAIEIRILTQRKARPRPKTRFSARRDEENLDELLVDRLDRRLSPGSHGEFGEDAANVL